MVFGCFLIFLEGDSLATVLWFLGGRSIGFWIVFEWIWIVFEWIFGGVIDFEKLCSFVNL